MFGCLIRLAGLVLLGLLAWAVIALLVLDFAGIRL